jgi:hypothetical protein
LSDEVSAGSVATWTTFVDNPWTFRATRTAHQFNVWIPAFLEKQMNDFITIILYRSKHEVLAAARIGENRQQAAKSAVVLSSRHLDEVLG